MKPLVELHLHLDGSLRIPTMLDIAKEEGVNLPGHTEKGLFEALRCGTIRESLSDYLTAFGHTVSVMQSRKALQRVTRELVEDVAKDGIKWAEIRFEPSLHTIRGLSQEDVVDAVLSGMHEGCDKTGIGVGLILCSMRHYEPEQTARIMDTAIQFRDFILGIDMAGDDLNFDALEHARHFRRAKDKGVKNVTCHAAEAGPAERAREAIDLFDATRIGHGTRLGEDPSVDEMVLMRGVALEVCITSNVQIKMVPSARTHPGKDYLRRGHTVTLNTDNRMLADTTLQEEFAIATKEWDLTDHDVKTLVSNAIEASFAPESVKDELRAELANG